MCSCSEKTVKNARHHLCSTASRALAFYHGRPEILPASGRRQLGLSGISLVHGHHAPPSVMDGTLQTLEMVPFNLCLPWA